MPTTTKNDTTSHGNHLPQRVDRAVPFYYQQFSEMADATVRTQQLEHLEIFLSFDVPLLEQGCLHTDE